ncbi:hypothetical protein KR084_001044 [Drosophila pseudotakahashii]|nr:hypothetical protein KR084_001044 [Drosophila pseudotakahashii]
MFSCCRSNPKAGKREKDKKSEEEKDEVQATEKGESLLNGKTEIQKEEPQKAEKQTIEADNPADEGTRANTAQLTQAEAANKSPPAATRTPPAPAPPPVAAAKETEALARSTHSSTSTAPPASMTSGEAEEADEVVVVAAVTPTTPPPQPPPTKSCLSRHNSAHQSIKKKVNISNRAEIIEPDPLPLLLLANQNQSSLLDDDEVFSDSLPPPKRESMCAPYIEGDVVSETLFFAHGLPSWFDDERLNELGCIEPPVTPVGRDELELKRQRLYTELLRAAHAAVEHSVAVRDNEPEAKPTAAVEHLESICERLETLVDRLERTLTAPQPIELPTPTLPPPPAEEKVEVGEVALPVAEKVETPPPPPSPPSSNMSVAGFEDIVAGPLSQYLTLSAKIGGDVAQHAELVKSAFGFQLQYVTLATQLAQPAQPKQAELLKPTSTQISAIQDYREKHRSSALFNHLSAISESIPALGWVCVEKTPGPYVKEMNDAGQFYTNRVLKEWKEKDVTHVEWARAWVQTLTELQAYIRQYHTTGLVWSGKGAAPAGGAPPPPPPGGLPPPPPMLDLSALKLDGGDDRSALFAQINQGADITKGLKKVTGEMQTHKNPSLRTGPAPFKSPAQSGGSQGAAAPAAAKAPVFERDGKKWIIEYQKNNTGLLVENAEMNNVVYVFRCEGSTLTVKGKVNNIVFDSCKKCSLLFDSVVASVEFVNCQSVQMQVLGSVPTVSIDKTDGCQMYLSKDSLGVEIVNSKSSEMNILLPDASGDYVSTNFLSFLFIFSNLFKFFFQTELALPEQYKTTIAGKTLKTVCVDSLG